MMFFLPLICLVCNLVSCSASFLHIFLPMTVNIGSLVLPELMALTTA